MSLLQGNTPVTRSLCLLALILTSSTFAQAQGSGGVTFPQPPTKPIFKPSIPESDFPTLPPSLKPTFPQQFPTQPPSGFPTQPPIGTPSGFPQKPSLGVLGSFVPQGMLIQQVVPGSPAEKVGLV